MADEPEHRALARWRRHVGDPVALDLAPPAPPGLRGFDVVCWNVAVGRGRLDALLDRVRAETDPARPLVLLLQEAYRADDTVPEEAPERGSAGGDLAPPRPLDVVELAREHGLSLRYAPSMRNGGSRSDRGNAVLATAALAGAHAFSLLYVRQRRVAVAAELAGVPHLSLVSAHLDTHRRLFGGSSCAAQAARLAEAVVRRDGPGGVILGGDFNTPLGERDPAFRALLRAGLSPPARRGRWSHTHHGPVRLLLDHLLLHVPDGRVESVELSRVDEDRGDRAPTVFGSDHHPLLARVALRAGASG